MNARAAEPNDDDNMNKGGRPTKLSRELHAQIIHLIECGNFPEVAAQACGIDRATYFRWMAAGKDGEEPFGGFATDVAQAVAVAETRWVERAQEGDGKGTSFGPSKAAAELIGRRFHRRWAQAQRVELAEQLTRFLDAAQRICSAEDYAKLLAELAGDAGETEAPGAAGELSVH